MIEHKPCECGKPECFYIRTVVKPKATKRPVVWVTINPGLPTEGGLWVEDMEYVDAGS
jgi:hypothetical protein